MFFFWDLTTFDPQFVIPSLFKQTLAEAVLKWSEDHAKAISKGLFRYAVQLEMVMRMLAELTEYTPEQVEELRREAINDVRRTYPHATRQKQEQAAERMGDFMDKVL
ncbi:hypothetical protein [Acutalibacter intestini]|uniref:hypothetical protein n=1 Tax=Acutalibacter intestini TaxID=3093659 RepID=UPI002AC99576|nr:hypothetical protein [Acutalibacter sp. M00204]